MKWTTLRHNGPSFSPPFEPKGFPIKVQGKPVSFNGNPDAEEMIYHWAARLQTQYVLDKVYQKNFWADLKKKLPADLVATRFPDDWDFTEYYNKIQIEKEKKKNRGKEEKEEEKAEKAARKEKFGVAIMDGKKIEIANYIIEPPGIFMGRGKNPLRGRWKPRVTSEDVTLNVGENAPNPAGKWGNIVHNHDAMWFAFWFDKLTGNYKYVMPSPKAYIRQTNDVEKFEKAMKLIDKMPEAIDFIDSRMDSKFDRETAVVCSLIARLGFRVGDEKDEDEADTYGATTLLRKHIEFSDDNEHYTYFKFLGKDSILYSDYAELPAKTVANIKKLMENKKPDDQVFANVTSKDVNELLGQFEPCLTAKVFRTALATAIMRNYLNEHKDKNLSVNEKIKIFKEANMLVAKKLNHRKTPTEAAKKGLKNKQAKLIDKKKLLKAYKEISKKELSQALKEKQRKVANYKRKYKNSNLRGAIYRANKSYRHKKDMWAKRIIRLEEQVEKLKLQTYLQKKSLDLNLGTSLASYVSPRITFGWAKEVKLELKHIYTKANIEKYEWAK